MAAVSLWRPVGPKEVDLIRQSGMRAFPPRLPEQPIFYPVLSEAYAVKIARDWNVPASGRGRLSQRLSAERFSGLSFEPVAYKKVVHIAWERWDANAQEPAFYPETGEPEDYLLEGAHEEQLAATMPRLWAWNVPKTIGLQVQGSNTFRRELHPGTDVAREYFIVWISERMKLWLEENGGKWLSFIAVIPR